ncbi:YybH family protein [Sporolactobacillus kofuensis]|uniref:YybH family protein n=1 Tax=Sporolactobacillus kofuensis TaxID=269672 RepID=A0ABW1WBP5_9BACL|nr:nuclear transport factor 2 family protein [Sporolactobacillus kofuensis]MCO7174974.1 nuclear transport factor 2 family protein [Sporolactobacillus kofuensis]
MTIDEENKEIKRVIDECDHLIKHEAFDQLIQHYSENAILVVKPGMVAHGREEIKAAFIKIAKYFDNSIVPKEGKMTILNSGSSALVLAQTLIETNDTAKETNEFSLDRRATYVFEKVDNQWLCSIDNSYGTSLLD